MSLLNVEYFKSLNGAVGVDHVTRQIKTSINDNIKQLLIPSQDLTFGTAQTYKIKNI